MHLAPLICVHDVQASSTWYQRLLGCSRGHGGNEYERLVAGDKLVLQLHRWNTEHEHGPLGDPALRPYGNGVLLWFELDDFDDAMGRASDLKVSGPLTSKSSEWSEMRSTTTFASNRNRRFTCRGCSNCADLAG